MSGATQALLTPYNPYAVSSRIHTDRFVSPLTIKLCEMNITFCFKSTFSRQIFSDFKHYKYGGFPLNCIKIAFYDTDDKATQAAMTSCEK